MSKSTQQKSGAFVLKPFYAIFQPFRGQGRQMATQRGHKTLLESVPVTSSRMQVNRGQTDPSTAMPKVRAMVRRNSSSPLLSRLLVWKEV